MSGPNAVDMYVGKRLRFGRTMQGMSQENIGEAIGVTFQQIQKHERGVNCIRASKLFELSKALKVNVSFFFEGMESENSKYVIPGASDSGNNMFDINLAISRDSMELMRAFSKIHDHSLRNRVTELVRAMGDSKGMF